MAFMLVEGASRHYQRQPRGTRCRHLASRIAAFIKGVQTLLDAFFLHTKAKVISVLSPLQVPAEVAMWLWNEVGILKHSSTLHPKLLITSPCLLRVNSTTTKPSTCPSSSPPAAVDTLRAAYSEINLVDPASTAYTGLCKLLDSLSQDDLKVLRDANIKWITSLADERVTKH
jgi:hypothetical protein